MISCSQTEVIEDFNVPIQDVECVDDKSPHLPLLAMNLPAGIQFNGRIISGASKYVVSNYPIYIYNNDTSVVILFNGMIDLV